MISKVSQNFKILCFIVFESTLATFKYEFDTGLEKKSVESGFIALSTNNETMDVTITASKNDNEGDLSNSVDGGCNGSFGILALGILLYSKRRS